MTYKELKQLIKENKKIEKMLYLSNFLTCKEEKMKEARITLIRNVFFVYNITVWTDYEYYRFKMQKSFKNKDEAADYAWKLYLEEYQSTQEFFAKYGKLQKFYLEYGKLQEFCSEYGK